MTVVNSIWYQLSNAFFLFSALFADILLIRFCLVCAYVLMLLNAALGWPLFPDVDNRPAVSLDTVVWCALNLTFHLYAFVKLVSDENFRKVRFENDDVEALWRLFRRRGGIARGDFEEIVRRGRFFRYREGEEIDCSETLYLVMDGLVECRILNLNVKPSTISSYRSNGGVSPRVSRTTMTSSSSLTNSMRNLMSTFTGGSTRNGNATEVVENGNNNNLRSDEPAHRETGNDVEDAAGARCDERYFHVYLTSGEMFDLKHANIFGFDLGFFNERFQATARGTTLLFGWSVESLKAMSGTSGRAPPVVVEAWKHVLLYSIAQVANRPWTRTNEPRGGVVSSPPPRHPHFAPFPVDPDRRDLSPRAIVRWLWRSLDFRLPKGLRHRAVPMVEEPPNLREANRPAMLPSTTSVSMANV